MTSSQDTVARSRPREQWADNLRVAVIAAVIIVHTATAYVVDVPWYYNDERTTSGVLPAVLSPLVLMGALFALGPLFLLAGWFSARSLAHRGPGGFVPRCGLFALGVHGAEAGWLRDFPPVLARRLGWVTAAGWPPASQPVTR
jgi:hypothetical protein